MSESSSLLADLLPEGTMREKERQREIRIVRQRCTCVPGAQQEPPPVPKSQQPGGEGRGPISCHRASTEGAGRPGGEGVTGI